MEEMEDITQEQKHAVIVVGLLIGIAFLIGVLVGFLFIKFYI